MTTLFDAIERADAGEVWQLCQKETELSMIDESTGMTALAHAAESGQREIVRTLLDAGANPDLGGVTTPLEAAVVEGHAEVAKILITAGADVNRAVEDGFTPLMTAAATGDLLLVEVLLAAGARPRKTNDEGQTAISLAKEAGHETIVTLLRQSRRRKRPEAKTADPSEDGKGKSGTSKSPKASRKGAPAAAEAAGKTNAEEAVAEPPTGAEDKTLDADTLDTETVEVPVEAVGEGTGEAEEAEEAKSKVADDRDGTAAKDGESNSGAAEAQDVETPESNDTAPQAAKRAEPKDQDTQPPAAAAPVEDLEEQTEALAALAEKNKGAALSKKVKSFEAGLEARDPEGRTLLMIAAKRGDVALVSWLLDQGADAEAIDQPRIGHTVLVHATQSLSPQRDQIIRRLVEAGVDINRPCGQRRRTPLMHAADADVYLDRVEGPVFAHSTKTLIELGAHMEAKDARGNTAWQLIKKDAIGAPTYGASRRRLHQMLRVLEHGGAVPIASHAV